MLFKRKVTINRSVTSVTLFSIAQPDFLIIFLIQIIKYQLRIPIHQPQTTYRAPLFLFDHLRIIYVVWERFQYHQQQHEQRYICNASHTIFIALAELSYMIQHDQAFNGDFLIPDTQMKP